MIVNQWFLFCHFEQKQFCNICFLVWGISLWDCNFLQIRIIIIGNNFWKILKKQIKLKLYQMLGKKCKNWKHLPRAIGVERLVPTRFTNFLNLPELTRLEIVNDEWVWSLGSSYSLSGSWLLLVEDDDDMVFFLDTLTVT